MKGFSRHFIQRHRHRVSRVKVIPPYRVGGAHNEEMHTAGNVEPFKNDELYSKYMARFYYTKSE